MNQEEAELTVSQWPAPLPILFGLAAAVLDIETDEDLIAFIGLFNIGLIKCEVIGENDGRGHPARTRPLDVALTMGDKIICRAPWQECGLDTPPLTVEDLAFLEAALAELGGAPADTSSASSGACF